MFYHQMGASFEGGLGWFHGGRIKIQSLGLLLGDHKIYFAVK